MQLTSSSNHYHDVELALGRTCKSCTKKPLELPIRAVPTVPVGMLNTETDGETFQCLSRVDAHLTKFFFRQQLEIWVLRAKF